MISSPLFAVSFEESKKTFSNLLQKQAQFRPKASTHSVMEGAQTLEAQPVLTATFTCEESLSVSVSLRQDEFGTFATEIIYRNLPKLLLAQVEEKLESFFQCNGKEAREMEDCQNAKSRVLETMLEKLKKLSFAKGRIEEISLKESDVKISDAIQGSEDLWTLRMKAESASEVPYELLLKIVHANNSGRLKIVALDWTVNLALNGESSLLLSSSLGSR